MRLSLPLTLSARIGALRSAASANPTLRRLELANVLWSAGEYVVLVGLVVFAYGAGGPALVAIVGILQAAPSVVLVPVVMRAVEGRPRDGVLRSVLAARALAIGAAAAVFLVAPEAPAAIVIGLAAVDAVASSLLRPIRGALVPSLARSPEELVASNVALTTGTGLAALVGPAVAAVILAVTGPGPTFLVGTAAFLAALGGAARIHGGAARSSSRAGTRSSSAPGSSSRGSTARGSSSGAGRDRGEAGLRTLSGLRHPRAIVGLIVAQRFVRGMLPVLTVALSVELLGAGDEGVGLLNAAVGLGGLVGGAASFLLVGRTRLAVAFLGGIAVWGLGILGPALLPVLVAALAFQAIGGVGKSVLEVGGVSLLQRTVPTAQRGAVFGILESLVTAALATGAVVAAILVEALGPTGALLVAGTLPILLAAASWPVMRTADASSVIADDDLRLLRGVPMFAPLRLTALEELAAEHVRVELGAGEEAVRQGETGDRFYVVASGRLETVIDGVRVRELGVGDAFGEIALLRDVARTATVRALEPARLLAIERASFLAAVTGESEAAAIAEGVVRGRLGG